MTRIPSAGTPIRLTDLLAASATTSAAGFRDDLARFCGVRHAGFASSGTAVFHMLLQVLSRRSGRKEVVLPAYTAPSLLLPILRAGLRPVVADVSLETFNMDMERAADAAGERTLAVLAVHMFGIPCDLPASREIAAGREAAAGCGAALIEDAASAMGAMIGGRPAGALGDAGFVSFNRGKNLSTASGGAWLTDDDELADELMKEEAALEVPGLAACAALGLKIAGLSLAVRPWMYTLAHPLLAEMKDTEPHRDFTARRYTPFQAGAGRSILRRLPKIVAARNERAARVRAILEDCEGITLPTPPPDAVPAYNQMPLLLPDRAARDRALAAARSTGVECTILYDRTVYQAYGLGPDECGGADRCPNAESMAGRLLLVPCHPLAPVERLERAAEAIRHSLTQRVTK